MATKRPKLNLVVIDPANGRARPGAWVTIYQANTLTIVSCYADDDVTLLPNPIQANDLGQVAVRVPSGLYDISMTWDGAPPTVVEDVIAEISTASLLTQPGDMVIGGPDGAPQVLHAGAENTVLVVDAGAPAWKPLGPDDGLPAGAAGSIVYYKAGGGLLVLPPGSQDQALVMAGGAPAWASILAAGTTLPISTSGDLVVGAASTGAVARLGAGPANAVLRVSESGPSGSLVWDTVELGRGVGQCYLIRDTSSGSLWLTPWYGNKLWIGEHLRTLGASVMLAPTGLSPDTLYYIYAYWTGSAVALEASTTAYAFVNGVWVKSGDPTRTYVGLAMPKNPGVLQWMDQPNNRLIRSYFNPQRRFAYASFTAPRIVTSNAPVEINAEIQINFLTSDFQASFDVTQTGIVWAELPAGASSFYSIIAIDGTQIAGVFISVAAAYQAVNIASSGASEGSLGTGFHTATLIGYVVGAGGRASWYGEAAGITACKLMARLVG